MSVPIMLAFDAVAVLKLPDTKFTDRNFAHQIIPGCDENYFNEIPFADVYHDRPPSNRMKEIHDRRMAEVVYPGHLPLQGNLKQIICRTALDRETLINLLGAHADYFRSIITVEQIHGSTFFHDGLCVKKIGFVDNLMFVTLKPPKMPPPNGKYQVQVERIANGRVNFQVCGSIGSDNTAFKVEVPPGVDLPVFRITLEGVIAFLGSVSTKQSEVF
jgi:hypothetical protein